MGHAVMVFLLSSSSTNSSLRHRGNALSRTWHVVPARDQSDSDFFSRATVWASSS